MNASFALNREVPGFRLRAAAGFLLLVTLLSGCSSDEPRDVPDATVADAGPMPTMDAGELDQFIPAACETDYEIGDLVVPTIESGLGFDLDGGGSELGCSDDGPDGIDHGVQGLDALIGATFRNVSLGNIIRRTSAEGFLRIAKLRVDPCRSTLQLLDESDQPLGVPTPIDIGADGVLSGRLDTLWLESPAVVVPEWADFTLRGVQVRGRLVDGDGDGDSRIEELLIGGSLEGARLVEFSDRIAPVSGFDPSLLRNILRTFLDMDTDEATPGCEDLSFHVFGSATEWVPSEPIAGANLNPDVRFEDAPPPLVGVGDRLTRQIEGTVNDATQLTLRGAAGLATVSLSRELPSLSNQPPYPYRAEVEAVATGDALIELLDGDAIRDSFEFTIVTAASHELAPYFWIAEDVGGFTGAYAILEGQEVYLRWVRRDASDRRLMQRNDIPVVWGLDVNRTLPDFFTFRIAGSPAGTYPYEVTSGGGEDTGEVVFVAADTVVSLELGYWVVGAEILIQVVGVTADGTRVVGLEPTVTADGAPAIGTPSALGSWTRFVPEPADGALLRAEWNGLEVSVSYAAGL